MNVGWPEAVIAIATAVAIVTIFFLLRRRLRKASVRMPGVHAGFEAGEEQRPLTDQEMQAHDSLLKDSEFTIRKGARTAFFRSKVKNSTVRVTDSSDPEETSDGPGPAVG
ncbi:hypothetical protein [Streptomyces sp. NPDC056525]|uniref:hypothetical protein n=1 Tax=unclassified Streptomyces TaxID=2593676 RepID=UPI0036826F60